jgi:hypothetical protein
MDDTTASLFVLAVSCVLGMPLMKAIRTLLVLRERIIIPILRIRTEGHLYHVDDFLASCRHDGLLQVPHIFQPLRHNKPPILR